MRRFPSSWSSTLAKLGFKRKRSSAKRSFKYIGGYCRRSSLEQLESRELLTNTPWSGTDLVIGDFDGDGNLDRLGSDALFSSTPDEVWTIDTKASAAAGGVEKWRVIRNSGAPGVGTLPATNQSNVQFVVGDFNGDRRDDILARTGASSWYMIQSRLSSAPATYPGEFVISSWGALSISGGWSTPVVGDFNGDGRDDLAAFNDSNPADKQWQVVASTGTSFNTPVPWESQAAFVPTAGTIMAGDFNGDGRDELMFKTGPNNWAIAVSDGSRFNVVNTQITVTTNWTSAGKGDFDGDEAEELLGWNTSAGRWETIKYDDHRGLSLDVNWGSALGALVVQPNIHIGDANRDGRDDLVAFNPTAGVNKWQVALSQQLTNGTNSFVILAAAVDGTNDWDRWFKDWDWGPSAAPYKFLNVDAPYQKFLDIFSDVYNTVELELYPGFMKGLTAAAQTKSANPWEQAALLVERLENAGFSTDDVEIASGTIEVPVAMLKSWLGLESKLSVFDAIRIGLDGNAKAINSGGVDISANSASIIEAHLSKVRFRHAWVQAKVPTATGFTSVYLDPTWKYKNLQPGILVDLSGNSSSVPGNRGTFDEFAYLANNNNQLPLEFYEDRVAEALLANNFNASLSDVAHDGPIVQRRFDLIPSGLASEIITTGSVAIYDNFAAIVADPIAKAELTHRVEISLQRSATQEKLRRRFNVSSPGQLADYKGYTGHTSAPFVFAANNVSAYGGGPGTSSVNEFDNTLTLNDVTSKSVPIGYTITPSTVLELEFKTDAAGIYFIGWDSNNVPNDNGSNANAAKMFEIFNTQSGGWYSQFGSFEKIAIPIGQYLEDATSQQFSRLVFGVDSNGSGSYSSAMFKNVRLYEKGIELTGSGTTLTVTQWGESFKSLLAPMTITKRTLLRFNMNVIQEGRFHGIGIDRDDVAENEGSQIERLFYLSGTNPAGFDPDTISGSPFHGVGTRTISIPIGDYFGNIDWLDRLTFVTDGGKVEFSDLSLVEGTENAFTHWTEQIVVADTPGDQAAHDIRLRYERSDLGQFNVYIPYLSVNGNHSFRYGSSNGFFHAGEESKINVQHLFPTALAKASDLSDLNRLNSYSRTASQVHALAIDANQYASAYITQLQHDLNEQQSDIYRRRVEGGAISEGEVAHSIGALLSYTGSKYWYDVNRSNAAIDSLMYTLGAQQRIGSGLITSDAQWIANSDVGYLNLPNVPSHMGVDFPNITHSSFDIGNAPFTHSNEAFQLVGYNASALENAILEETINTKSISTIRGLQDAYRATQTGDFAWVFDSRVENGQRKIYRRGSIGNSPDASEPYSPAGGDIITVAEVKSGAGFTAHSQAVRDLIAAMLENANASYGAADAVITVIVPNKKSAVDNWHGSVYLAEILSSSGRSGKYIIAPDGGPISSGGYSGGLFKPDNKSLSKGSFVNQTFAGDPVNIANGNMFRDEVDFKLANPIVPLDFTRHYDSQNKLDVGFGVGWVHGFTGFVYEEQDPVDSNDKDYIWLRGNGERHTFEDLNFNLPNTLFGDVESQGPANDKRLTAFKDKSGALYLFEIFSTPFTDATTGKKIFSRLVVIANSAVSQGVTINYESATSVRVKEVHSLSTPTRYLEFTYHANNAIDVKRFDAGQLLSTWAYVLSTNAAYSGKRLTQVKHANLSSNITTYSYYNDGPSARKGLIKQITEPNGELHAYEYFANGRVFRVTDGEGNQQSFNYNLFRNLTEFTDERGHVETYIHQDNGLLTKQIHDDRSRLEFTWGPQSSGGSVEREEFLMQTSTDERGGQEIFDYYTFDPNNSNSRSGELFTSRSKDGILTTYEYEVHPYISSVKRITVTPQNGTPIVTAEYTHDSISGNVLTAKDAEGHTTAYEYYDSAPVYLRGLRKSETQPKGVAGQTLSSWEPNEAVSWEVVSPSVTVTGNRLSIRLLSSGIAGEFVRADAIRIDRIGDDDANTRILDDATSGNAGFRNEVTNYTNGTDGAYGGSYFKFSGGTAQPVATWIFDDLEPGNYRVSATWPQGAGGDPSTTYHKEWCYFPLPPRKRYYKDGVVKPKAD